VYGRFWKIEHIRHPHGKLINHKGLFYLPACLTPVEL
jgi:hypothetical protein